MSLSMAPESVPPSGEGQEWGGSNHRRGREEAEGSQPPGEGVTSVREVTTRRGRKEEG